MASRFSNRVAKAVVCRQYSKDESIVTTSCLASSGIGKSVGIIPRLVFWILLYANDSSFLSYVLGKTAQSQFMPEIWPEEGGKPFAGLISKYP
jgi:hypothetical protein